MKRDGYIYKIIEMFLYVAFVVLGFYLAFFIRFGMNPLEFNTKPFFENIPYIIIVSIVIFYMYNIVSTVKNTLFENAVIIGISLILIDTVVIAIIFFNRGFSFPRSVFLIGFFIQFMLIYFLKFIVITVIRKKRKKKNILIFAPKDEADKIAKKILLDKTNYDNVKYICNTMNNEIYSLVDDSEKVFIGNSANNNDKTEIIKYCSEMNKVVYLVPGLYEIATINSKSSQINDLLIFKIKGIGLSFEQMLVKRTLDIIISLIGLIITSPILLIVAIVIKVYDGGPVFFKQERVTKDKRIFYLYKLRTMIVDAEKQTGPVLATEKDPRITPLGSFLRATRIDELPQLINVLKGDMSIVGPRPERPYFVEQYNEEIEEFKYRVLVKAGITGLAQVLGKYSTEAESKAKYDLLYIYNYSLLLDIKIIFNTIKIIFFKDSSAGLEKDKKLDEIFNDMNIETYEELGITKVDNK